MFGLILCSPAERGRSFLKRGIAASGGGCTPLRRRLAVSLCAGLIAWVAGVGIAAENIYPLEVLPPECRRMTDPKTGAELLFLTTAPENDANLYFHEYSWLADESVVLFTSARAQGGLMGYVTATG